MDINVEALGGQWNLAKFGAFLVALYRRLVRPVLGVYSVLFYPNNGTFFPMAGGEHKSWKQCQRKHSFVGAVRNHEVKDSRAVGTDDASLRG